MSKLKLKLNSRLVKKKVRKQGFAVKKQCRFKNNEELALSLDYKNVDLLSNFLTERGKILPSRVSGTSSYYQRKLSQEIKLARSMALLPYCSMHR
ncbi:30S ribosomal protein S18 [Candidatus Babeliales bacterium]|nr:30S ribosomal protein S18 [Candidatus Babeliales bacterium]